MFSEKFDAEKFFLFQIERDDPSSLVEFKDVPKLLTNHGVYQPHKQTVPSISIDIRESTLFPSLYASYSYMLNNKQ